MVFIFPLISKYNTTIFKNSLILVRKSTVNHLLITFYKGNKLFINYEVMVYVKHYRFI